MTNTAITGRNLSDAFRFIYDDEYKRREQAEANRVAAWIVILNSVDSTSTNPPSAAELVSAGRILKHAPEMMSRLREVDSAHRKMRADYEQLVAQRAEANRLESKAAELYKLAKDTHELFVFNTYEPPRFAADAIA